MQEIPQGIRFKRALKKFLLFFGIAIPCLFIPVAHFVLVPLFLILSVAMSFIEYKKKYHYQSDSVDCIHCKEKFAVDITCSDKSARVYCTHCGAQNSIRF